MNEIVTSETITQEWARKNESLGFMLRGAPFDTPIEVVKEVEAQLARVEELLRDPSNWCKGATARCWAGTDCHPDDENAVKWDIVGAIVKARKNKTRYYGQVAHGSPEQIVEVAVQEALWEEDCCKIRGRLSLDYWNDYVASHADVMRVVQRAREIVRLWLIARGA